MKTPKDNNLNLLNKGKIKSLGFFEKLPIKMTGKKDGRNGLPRECNGQWSSPFIEKEIRAYDETASRIWGRLQNDKKDDFARLEELMSTVLHTKAQLDEAEALLEKAKAAESAVSKSRKNGESKLTDEQVAQRRARESGKRLSSARGKVASLRTKLTSEIDEFSGLRSAIIEENNTTRLICLRLRDHLYQRLAVYWDAVLRVHPEGGDMPVIPEISIDFRSEEAYLKPHYRQLLEQADLLNTINEKAKEAA